MDTNFVPYIFMPPSKTMPLKGQPDNKSLKKYCQNCDKTHQDNILSICIKSGVYSGTLLIVDCYCDV